MRPDSGGAGCASARSSVNSSRSAIHQADDAGRHPRGLPNLSRRSIEFD
jgi:hypothetical protein